MANTSIGFTTGPQGPRGLSGYSGQGGFSGSPGVSGYSGFSGDNPGSSGKSGYSGYSGSGISGYSGRSGYSGWSGRPGLGGFSGYSGYSGVGISGYSGKDGHIGVDGESGYSGYSGLSISGYSGASGHYGLSGTSGKSGPSGYSGLSGYSGFSSASGYSGFSGYSGASGYYGQDGLSGYSGFSGVSGSGFIWRGPWNAGSISYYINDTVSSYGTTYVCILPHVSTVDSSVADEPGRGSNWETYWQIFTTGFAWKGPWVGSAIPYYANDTVSSGGTTYVCILPHVSGVDSSWSDEPGTGTNWHTYWQLFVTGFTWKGPWSGAAVRYFSNDVISHQGSTFICIFTYDSGFDSAWSDEPGVGTNWTTYWNFFATGTSGYSGQSGYSGKDASAIGVPHSGLSGLEYDQAGHIGFQRTLVWDDPYKSYLIL